ncbi:hypothetical protein PILCRDRAFT_534861 [Piloderma croceum F 1598]|uniref:Uncharacterized protein n=1 Tax=Piloderma croceum (strain F 1598) TaxID=765440 RepID=A0A0C3F748_PILCF|nr:hypothetical protein PILCRDRAFT_534861 [Piloderma croceum F 1598]
MRPDDFPDHFTPLDSPLSAFANFGFFPFPFCLDTCSCQFSERWGWVYILSLRPDFIEFKILLVNKSVRGRRKLNRELTLCGENIRENWDSEAGLY